MFNRVLYRLAHNNYYNINTPDSTTSKEAQMNYNPNSTDGKRYLGGYENIMHYLLNKIRILEQRVEYLESKMND